MVGGLVVALCAVEPLATWQMDTASACASTTDRADWTGRTARRANGNLGVEDVLAAEHQRRSGGRGGVGHAYHMSHAGITQMR